MYEVRFTNHATGHVRHIKCNDDLTVEELDKIFNRISKLVRCTTFHRFCREIELRTR